MDWATQAVGQQHITPLHPRCEARRREVVVICGCGNGLARDALEASKADGGLRVGGPQGLQAKPGGDTRSQPQYFDTGMITAIYLFIMQDPSIIFPESVTYLLYMQDPSIIFSERV